MKVEVEMLAFGNGEIREVDVPDEIWEQAALDVQDETALLELVFMYGQNDVQSRPFYSVSVGDVIRLGDQCYRVEPVGFSKVVSP